MAALTINVSGSAAQRLILTADTVLTLSDGFDGQVFTLIVQQDSTGSHALTYANVPAGPVVSQAANSDTVMQFIYDANVNAWVGAVGSAETFQTVTTTSTITQKSGLVLIGSAGAINVTFPAPIAGDQNSGGDDGKLLTFSIITTHAHTAVTAANKIQGQFDTVTFANAGDCITLIAAGGVWYTFGGKGTNTLTEV